MLAFDRSFPKKIKDRWDYCNKEAIAKKALEMYKDRPSDQDITNVIEEYKLYKLGPQKVAGLWKPPFIRMKRPTSICTEMRLQIRRRLEVSPLKIKSC